MSDSPHWSEVLKNVVTATGILVAGFWAYYEWENVFPKTEADNIAAAASVRTDVAGRLSVQFGDGGASSAFDPEDTDVCETNRDGMKNLDVLVSGNALVSSASNRPVFAKFSEILVSRADNYVLRTGTGVVPIVEPITFENFGKVSSDAIIGGLADNRVEQGQSIQTSFIFALRIPYECNREDQLISFQANFVIVPINPTDGKQNSDASVKKKFITVCQLNVYGDGDCDISNIEAFGQ